MRLVERLVASLIAVLAACGVFGSTVSAAAPASAAVPIHTYDLHHDSAEPLLDGLERGPPAAHAVPAADSVDPGSPGASAPPQLGLTRSYTDYDRPVQFAHDASAGVTTWTVLAGRTVDVRAVEGPICAANSGRVVANACRTNSFAGDTLVLMADGTKKPIKDVTLGDRIIATDPLTGERGPRKVIDLIRHGGLHTMVAVRLADGTTIDATDRHPFWVESRGEWVDAIDLQPGDVVVTADGVRLTVESVGISQRDLTAYNLSIAGLHTYHVGDDEVLVHNCDALDLNFTQVQDRIGSHVWGAHGAGTSSVGTKFADDLGPDDLFAGLVDRLNPGTATGRINEVGNHEHILNWVGAGANGENRVRVWMAPNGELGSMWPIR